jgi:hypothetical protein
MHLVSSRCRPLTGASRLINASAISMGLLSDRGPPKWHPATDAIKHTCQQAAAYCKSQVSLRRLWAPPGVRPGANGSITHRGVQGVDLSKLALHFSLANPKIPTTLVSTANPGLPTLKCCTSSFLRGGMRAGC